MAKRTKKAISPRKIPRQERSRETVDAILQATTYILARRGWASLTTNAIAERAGVNIASLYQYFPNKEAIVDELRRRYQEEIHACAAPVPSGTLREALQVSITNAIRAQQLNPELFRVFAEELPRAAGRVEGALPQKTSWNTEFPDLLADVPDAGMAGWIMQTVTRSILREAALEKPELLGNPLFVSELATLLERYLVRGGKAARRRGPHSSSTPRDRT